MRLCWVTDIHLDVASPGELDRLAKEIRETGAERLLVTGDIADGPKGMVCYLIELQERVRLPISFVLGNHDCWGGWIQEAREAARELCSESPNFQYLGRGEIFSLTEKTVLTGVDGWSDGLAASFMNSRVEIRDYEEIRDFQKLPKFLLQEKLRELGRDEARIAQDTLLRCMELPQKKVLFLTHPPPFRGAAWYKGLIQDQDFAPHFVGAQVGETLAYVMCNHEDRHLTVLCGHTHHEGEFNPLENLKVLTGGSMLKQPRIAGVLDVE